MAQSRAGVPALIRSFSDCVIQLRKTLPRGWVESPFLAFDPTVLIEEQLGRLDAPEPIYSTDISLSKLPRYCNPGRSLQFDVVFSARGPVSPGQAASLASLALHLNVDATVYGDGDAEPLPYDAIPLDSTAAPTVRVSLHVPGSALGERIIISSITFAGQSLAGFPSDILSIDIKRRGLWAPLQLPDTTNRFVQMPAVSDDGTLYASMREGKEVKVFAPDGSTLPPLTLSDFDVPCDVHSVAVDDTINALFVCNANGAASKVVAIDSVTRKIRWSTAAGVIPHALGLCALPQQGILIVSSWRGLVALRAIDGVEVGDYGMRSSGFIAVHEPSSIFFSEKKSGVVALQWQWLAADGSPHSAPDARIAGAFRELGNVPLNSDVPRQSTEAYPALAVMPPPSQVHVGLPAGVTAAGVSSSTRSFQLLVAMTGTPYLRVLSLPDLEVVCDVVLPVEKVIGLAADPSGTALAVCCPSTGSIHVLPWPLDGMPML
jgi:hypothetical protein